MAMNPDEIAAMLREGIPGAKIEIEDVRGDGEYYTAKVSSESFRGKSRIQQHQMVYAAMKGKIGTALHALSIQTQTE